MTKYRIKRIEMSGEEVNFEVATDIQEAEDLLQWHWEKQKKAGNEPTPIENHKFKCCGAETNNYIFLIEEIDL